MGLSIPASDICCFMVSRMSGTLLTLEYLLEQRESIKRAETAKQRAGNRAGQKASGAPPLFNTPTLCLATTFATC